MTAKLYCWRPDGHGPLTFFVVAESEESAKEAVALEVQKIVEDEHGSDWSVSGWPDDGYKLEIYEPGVVAVNDND